MKPDITIYWSDEDACFLAEAPNLTGCISHGDTRVEALENLELVLAEYAASKLPDV